MTCMSKQGRVIGPIRRAERGKRETRTQAPVELFVVHVVLVLLRDWNPFGVTGRPALDDPHRVQRAVPPAALYPRADVHGQPDSIRRHDLRHGGFIFFRNRHQEGGGAVALLSR